MVVLMFGDVVGEEGCRALAQKLPRLKREHGADVVIVNGENAAEGNGILPTSVDALRGCGVDIITTGNHALRRREIYDVIDRQDGVLRPANYHPDTPGSGVYIFDGLKYQLAVINLQGSVYIQSYENPFTVVDRILKELPTKNIIVDFHAEATSEKLCMGYHLEGRVSAVIGTHTHVPTADGRILPKGTGYITDVGMCGARNSVLGVETQQALYRMRTGLPTRFTNAKDEICLSGAVIEIDTETGKCTNFKAFTFV